LLLQFGEELVDIALADAGRGSAHLGDGELVYQQRIDERRYQRPLGAPAGEDAGSALELLVSGD
jgi:hypothetical protein